MPFLAASVAAFSTPVSIPFLANTFAIVPSIGPVAPATAPRTPPNTCCPALLELYSDAFAAIIFAVDSSNPFATALLNVCSY